MCSKSTRTLFSLLAALALSLPLSLGCGHKANPKPPPQKIPEAIKDLKVSQRGDELMISFTYPQVTISGLPIEDIVAIELWEYEVPVPDFSTGDDEEEGDAEEGAEGEKGDEEEGEAREDSDAEPESGADTSDTASSDEPAEEGTTTDPVDAGSESEEAEGGEGSDEDSAEGDEEGDVEDDEDEDEDKDRDRMVLGSKETLLEIDPREFVAASRLRLTLQGESLSNAIRGPSVEITLKLADIEPGEKTAFVYGVKSFQSLNRASRFSNLSKIIPRVTPDPPTPELEAVSNGIKINWEFAGEEPIEYRFYRREALASEFAEYFGAREGEEDQFLDATAEAGKSYVYAMTAVVNRSPLVESVLSAPVEIDYRDVFPPEAPSDLVVLTEAGTARLLWESSSDSDVIGYVVYRRSGSGEFERLNDEPLLQSEYSDTSAESGRSYAYRIVALDREGNMSDPSEEVSARIP